MLLPCRGGQVGSGGGGWAGNGDRVKIRKVLQWLLSLCAVAGSVIKCVVVTKEVVVAGSILEVQLLLREKKRLLSGLLPREKEIVSRRLRKMETLLVKRKED